jgi:hypothetical protein
MKLTRVKNQNAAMLPTAYITLVWAQRGATADSVRWAHMQPNT